MMSFTPSPRYELAVMPSRVSVGADRGLKYCPAIRPTFTTGIRAPYVRITAICRTVCSRARIESAVFAANVSAHPAHEDKCLTCGYLR